MNAPRIALCSLLLLIASAPLMAQSNPMPWIGSRVGQPFQAHIAPTLPLSGGYGFDTLFTPWNRRRASASLDRALGPERVFFQTPTYGTGIDPTAVAASDLNSDGRVDLIVANQCGDDVLCQSPG